eukprot:CAMPEP_0172440136 /NCGR_PEP_ID=MMETSP1065-20121228/881_1 /TAXON_ID=265537 /ORGANISM="Amphiprora paludosa, Strain CCMP125" /LENGTH=368 /DNA_ID=CAMNT_0013188919 /DNA_START=113 /DNA_END=1219 /DNA_ORIENTATION=+
MSNYERKQVVEDKPQMRSMQIMSAAPMPLMPRSAPIANKIAPSRKAPQQVEGGWSVGPLSPLPPIYCLERTHLHVDDSAANVGDRIAECLRKESIAAVYHKNENLVDAETEDNVQFSIRLFEGKNGSVLVEVQKASGCCYSYCQAAKAVLRAAKGIRTPAKRRTFSIPPCVPKVSAEESEAATRDGLELAEQLLAKQQMDANLLAVESLVHLSKATENQCFTARCILSGQFQVKLLSLIDSFDSASGHDEIERDHLNMMKRHSLAILANCFAALERSGELVSLLQQQQELTSKGVVSALVSEVAAAGERPHDACQAANCLRTLLAASEETKRKAADLNACEAISQARHTGVCRHAALEDACTQLRTLL